MMTLKIRKMRRMAAREAGGRLVRIFVDEFGGEMDERVGGQILRAGVVCRRGCLGRERGVNC